MFSFDVCMVNFRVIYLIFWKINIKVGSFKFFVRKISLIMVEIWFVCLSYSIIYCFCMFIKIIEDNNCYR